MSVSQSQNVTIPSPCVKKVNCDGSPRVPQNPNGKYPNGGPGSNGQSGSSGGGWPKPMCPDDC